MRNTRTIALALAIAVISSGSAAYAKEHDVRSNGTTTVRTDNGLHKGWWKQGKIPGLQSVIGTVTAIDGTTVTIKGENGEVYSVNASTTKVVGNGKATTTLSSLEVGDKVVVKGSIVGTSSATTTLNAKVIFQDIGKFFKILSEKISRLFERIDRNDS